MLGGSGLATQGGVRGSRLAEKGWDSRARGQNVQLDLATCKLSGQET